VKIGKNILYKKGGVIEKEGERKEGKKGKGKKKETMRKRQFSRSAP